MITLKTLLDPADNTGARSLQCIHVLGQHRDYAHIGDLIKVSVKDAIPTGLVKKGEVARKYVVKGVALTAGAKAAIEAAGGRVE